MYMRNALQAHEKQVGPKPIQARVVDDHSNQDEDDQDDEEDEGSSYEEPEDEVRAPPKRRRTEVSYATLDDPGTKKRARASLGDKTVRRVKSMPKIRGCRIGVWRDSNQVDDDEKHSVFGFIDVNERLRTRIYGVNRRNQEIRGNMPTGAGGCWVTFERILYDDHLKLLDPLQLKEYVKLRSLAPEEDDLNERATVNARLVEQAKEIRAAQEIANPSSTPRPPRHRPSQRVSKAEKARLAQEARLEDKALVTSTSEPATPRDSPITPSSFVAVNGQAASKADVVLDKPGNVVIGYWRGSDAIEEADKHAASGVIGENESFRCKIQRYTRDGRYMEGNFPTAHGGLWLHFPDVVLEPHLEGFSRAEVKEYVRIRSRHLRDLDGEDEGKWKAENERRAARQAREMIAHLAAESKPVTPKNVRGAAKHESKSESKTRDVNMDEPEPEIRHSARAAAKQQAAAEKAMQEQADGEAHNRRNSMETRGNRAHETPLPDISVQTELKGEVKKTNKAWTGRSKTNGHHSPDISMPMEQVFSMAPPINTNIVRQPTLSSAAIETPSSYGSVHHHTLAMHTAPLPEIQAAEYVQPLMGPATSKIHNGIRYERKQNGPFVGKLVSAAQILTIDGEDFVEYRVLTKPSFF